MREEEQSSNAASKAASKAKAISKPASKAKAETVNSVSRYDICANL
jgi:hypothetical protein